jgi:hypothetical protein
MDAEDAEAKPGAVSTQAQSHAQRCTQVVDCACSHCARSRHLVLELKKPDAQAAERLLQRAEKQQRTAAAQARQQEYAARTVAGMRGAGFPEDEDRIAAP